MERDPHVEERVLVDFLARVADARLQGALPPVEDFLREFGGHEELIRKEYAALAQDPDPTLALAIPAGEATAPGTLEKYELVREIGRGGQGVVYLAEDTLLGRSVALKVLNPGLFGGGDGLPLRVRREVEAVTRLDHPNICVIYEAGFAAGSGYIAMRHVPGEPLSEQLRRGLWSPSDSDAGTDSGSTPARQRRAVALVEKTARAVAAAHRAGVVHRDLKPSNVMLTPQGEPVLLDFGLARSEDSSLPGITATGDVVGTPAYMAPERFGDRNSSAPRVDVWSLGVILYELVCGRRPFAAATSEGLVHRILTTEPVAPRRLAPVSRDLEVVILTALTKEPTRRYRTADDLAEDLRRLRMHEPIRARAIGPAGRVVRWAQRNPALAVLVLVLFVASAGSLVAALNFRDLADREKGARQQADTQRLAARSALAGSLASQAELLLASTRPGRRGSAMELLEAAAAELPDGEVSAPTRLAIRNHFAQALYSSDASVDYELPPAFLQGGLMSTTGDRAAIFFGNPRGRMGMRIVDLATGEDRKRFTEPRPRPETWALDPARPRHVRLTEDSRAFELRDETAGEVLGLFPLPEVATRGLPMRRTSFRHARLVVQPRISHDGRTLVSLVNLNGRKPTRLIAWRLTEPGVGEIVAELDDLPQWIEIERNSRRYMYPAGQNGLVMRRLSDHAQVGNVAVKDPLIRALFHPDGERLVAIVRPKGGFSDVVRMLSKEGETTATILVGAKQFHARTAALDRHGRFLAIGCENEEIRVFDLRSRDERVVVDAHHGTALDFVGWIEDGRLVTLSRSGPLRAWDLLLENPHRMILPVRSFRLPGSRGALTWSGDGRILAAGDRTGAIHVLDTTSARSLRVIRAPAVRTSVSLFLSHDGSQVARLANTAARVWEVEGEDDAGEEIRLPKRASSLAGAGFLDDGTFEIVCQERERRLLVVDDDGEVDTIDETPQSIATPGSGERLLVERPDGLALLTVATQDALPLAMPDIRGARFNHLCLSPDGRWAAVLVHDMDAVDPLSAPSDTRDLLIFELEQGRLHDRVPFRVSGASGISFAKDGSLLAIPGAQGEITLRHVEERRTWLTWRLPEQDVHTCRFDPTGTRLATWAPGAPLRVHDVSGLAKALDRAGIR